MAEQRKKVQKENINHLGLQEDDKIQQERKNLWKNFGRESEAGKLLFNLYKCHEPPQINYPQPKTKKMPLPIDGVQQTKACPQKTEIQYPELKKEPQPKFHQIDFVPKRKKEEEIRKEIDNYYSKRDVPTNRGVDRKKVIQRLQKKFQDGRGALPKGAELPQVSEEPEVNQKILKDIVSRKVDDRFQGFLQKQGKYYQDIDPQYKEEPVVSKSEIDELNEIFDNIMVQIEERQKYLDEIEHLDEPKMKEKIKNQIISRVSELQKVSELRNHFNSKN